MGQPTDPSSLKHSISNQTTTKMAAGGLKDKVLSNLTMDLRIIENRLLSSLRQVSALLPPDVAANLDITSKNLTYSSVDLSFGHTTDTVPAAKVIPKDRLESQSSTTAVWSGDESGRVPPMHTEVSASDLNSTTTSNISRQTQIRGRSGRQEPYYITMSS